MLTGEKGSARRTTCRPICANMSNTNPKWCGLGLKRGLHADRPTTNGQHHGKTPKDISNGTELSFAKSGFASRRQNTLRCTAEGPIPGSAGSNSAATDGERTHWIVHAIGH
jgi:hypothetical protein